MKDERAGKSPFIFHLPHLNKVAAEILFFCFICAQVYFNINPNIQRIKIIRFRHLTRLQSKSGVQGLLMPIEAFDTSLQVCVLFFSNRLTYNRKHISSSM